MKVGLLVLAVFLSQSSLAADIYRCIDSQGKQIFADKKCPKNTTQATIRYKKTSFDDQLIGSAPGKSKVVDISTIDDETLVNYQFSTQAELQEFMRLSARLSGKNVNLLNVVMPTDKAAGKAKVQITDKPGFLGVDPKAKN